MKRIIGTGLCLLLLSGCIMPLRTESHVNMQGAVKGEVQMQGKMDAHVRSETAPLVDVGPLHEVPVPPVACSCSSKVAVLDVDGILANVNNVGPYSIGENPVATFKEKLDACAADPEVKAVVLRINTPGGGVAATDLMWHELVRFRQATGKPVIACLLDLGAGGGYFLATGCDTIFAIPSSVVGGIGVMLNAYAGADGMARFEFYDRSVRAGQKIDMGSVVRSITADERKLLNQMAEGYHNRFKEVVTRARPKIKADAELFDGRVMTSQLALDQGLIDGIGYLDDAVSVACKLAKVDTAQPIMYRRQGDAARSMYATTPNRPIHVSGLLQMSIPGPERPKLPVFLYMWQAEPTMVKLSGM